MMGILTYVTRVHEQSDLGVLLASNLKFGSHICHIVPKANTRPLASSFEYVADTLH